MTESRHGLLTTQNGIHVPMQWSFADKTARDSTTNPKTLAAYTADDIGKLALQEDDNSLWLLTDTTPTWVGVSVNSAVSGLTAGRVVFVDSDGSLTDDADLTFATDTLTATKIESTSITDSGLTSGRLVFAGTGGVLEDSSKLTHTATDQILINTTYATTGAQLDVAGDIVVSDGAGGEVARIDNNGQFIGNHYGKTVKSGTVTTGNSVTFTVTTSGIGQWHGAFLVIVRGEGDGTLTNQVRLVQVAYTNRNMSLIGVDTTFGALSLALALSGTSTTFSVTATVSGVYATKILCTVLPVGYSSPTAKFILTVA